jgi:hypothetical protein
MQRHFSTRPLRDEEWEEIEAVLLDEIEIQVWYSIAFDSTLGGELVIPIQ